jgi:hypothetical protein
MSQMRANPANSEISDSYTAVRGAHTFKFGFRGALKTMKKPGEPPLRPWSRDHSGKTRGNVRQHALTKG